MPKGVCNIRPLGSNNCWPTTTIALATESCVCAAAPGTTNGDIYTQLQLLHNLAAAAADPTLNPPHPFTAPTLCISSKFDECDEPNACNSACRDATMGLYYIKVSELAKASSTPPLSDPGQDLTGLPLGNQMVWKYAVLTGADAKKAEATLTKKIWEQIPEDSITLILCANNWDVLQPVRGAKPCGCLGKIGTDNKPECNLSMYQYFSENMAINLCFAASGSTTDETPPWTATLRGRSDGTQKSVPDLRKTGLWYPDYERVDEGRAPTNDSPMYLIFNIPNPNPTTTVAPTTAAPTTAAPTTAAPTTAAPTTAAPTTAAPTTTVGPIRRCFNCGSGIADDSTIWSILKTKLVDSHDNMYTPKKDDELCPLPDCTDSGAGPESSNILEISDSGDYWCIVLDSNPAFGSELILGYNNLWHWVNYPSGTLSGNLMFNGLCPATTIAPTTTAPPTTAPPTTAPPTTITPTTIAPTTTDPPTTAPPTTAPPTTAPPTTAPPTTAPPTTAPPTTAPPTTAPPTTAPPTTAAPTTAPPTTAPPTTAAPTTAPPTTAPPTTAPPTTAPPTTAPPTTAAPTTAPPTTAPPTTAPPTTAVPTTVPPTTAAPTTTCAP